MGFKPAISSLMPFGLVGQLLKKSKNKGMPSMPGQSPLGMSTGSSPGNSLQAARGQRGYLS